MDQTTPSVDLDPSNRPGVPMERNPEPLPGVHWTRPERQPVLPRITKRSDLHQLTPVFGTAQPLKGLSGVLRRLAYRTNENLVRHWLLLLMADRVDVVESRAARFARRGALPATGGLLIWAGIRALRSA